MAKDELDDLGELDELDDLGDLDADLPAAKGKKKDEKKESDPRAPHFLLRIALGGGGLMLVAGFFLPWIRLDALNPEQAARGEGIEFVSGLQLAVGGDTLVTTVSGMPWWVLFLIPLFGAALAAVGSLGNRFSGVIGAGLGLLIVGYGVVTVVMLFFQTTSFGLWLVLGGAFISVMTGTLAWARSRQARPAAPKKKR